MTLDPAGLPARATGSIVRFEDVSISFGDTRALDRLSFEIRAGETCVVFGAAGSGKTVMLKLALGLMVPDSGRVFLFDQDIAGMREQELPYNPIIALNDGGAVLHYQVLEKQLPAERHSLLIDAGAEFSGYASDITRTHALRAGDFATLIERMDEMQLALCAQLRAGVDWKDVQLRSHELIGGVLKEADIITCSAAEGVATGVTSVFYPHGIGHLLGIEVHDVGGFMASPDGGDSPRPEGHPFLRLTRVLQKGFVVTVEPGIYFIDQLLDAARADSRGGKINWSRVASLRKFGGIRIEDDVAITDTGCENLTRDAFRERQPKATLKGAS